MESTDGIKLPQYIHQQEWNKPKPASLKEIHKLRWKKRKYETDINDKILDEIFVKWFSFLSSILADLSGML